MNVYPLMTRQVFNIAHLRWQAGLFVLLFVAACGASAPPQSESSIPGASQPSQETVVIAEAPVGAITPSPDHSPTDTIPGVRALDVQSSDAVTASEPVVSTRAPADTPAITVPVTTPTLAAPQPPFATPADAVNPMPSLDQPVVTPTIAPTTVPQQNADAKLGENPSPGEVTPIPTAVPTPIEELAAPTDIPTPVAVKEVIDSKETSAADGGAHRFILPSALGKQISLDEYLGRGNVVLIFYRAFW